jgi:hypothetical protein
VIVEEQVEQDQMIEQTDEAPLPEKKEASVQNDTRRQKIVEEVLTTERSYVEGTPLTCLV